jgi:1,4-dihydroxy-2-naphthoyl-CoA hydrolase
LEPFFSQICGDLVQLNAGHQGNLAGLMGIEVTTVGAAYVAGKMPVDERTIQPFGILHGGASIVLAETLGSLASYLLVAQTKGARVAGIEVSGSHLRAVGTGEVFGTCRPTHIGRTLHFWQIDIRDGQGRLCCVAKLTVSVSIPGPEVAG